MDFAGNWNTLSKELKDIDGLFGSPAPAQFNSTQTNSPSTSYLDDNEMNTFGSFPLSSLNDDDEALKVVNCKDCARPVQKSALEVHLLNCAKSKQITQAKQTNKKSKLKKEDTPTSTDGSRKRRLSDASQHSTASSTSPLKKSRKLDNADKSKPKGGVGIAKEKPRKERDEGPVDLDSQCGVINARGIPCSRSLTCKTHPMGAKRAVEGRSKPFDVLTYEFELKRKPELADKPLPKAVTQFEADKAANKKKQNQQQQNVNLKLPATNLMSTPSQSQQQTPQPPPIIEKPVTVTSWDDPSLDTASLPPSGMELEMEITKIRAATTIHHPRPLAVPASRMAGLVKKRVALRRCLMK